MQLEGQSQPRKGLHCYAEGLKQWGLTEGISQVRSIIRPTFLGGSPLRKVTWKTGHRKEDQRAIH